MNLVRETIAEAFFQCLETAAERPAVFTFRDGGTQSYSWGRIAEDVLTAAANLQAGGLELGDCVAQISENRYEWLIADLAILLSGGVHVPLHAQLPPEAIQRQVRESDAKLVIVSNDEQWSKVAELVAEGVRIFTHEICDQRSSQSLLGGELSSRKREQVQTLLAHRRHEIQPNTPATLLFTSGTTGDPRGVMLSHRNLVSNASALIAAFAPARHERRLNFLPFSHIFARTCDWYVTIVSQTELGLATSRESILDDCRQFKPQVLNGVPYFFDRIRRLLQAHRDSPSKSALPAMLGGNVQLCNVGGAALSEEVFDFYQERGIVLGAGYGLTEAAPVITLSTDKLFRRGSVGQAAPGVELRIADGEILARGPSVMLGYWKDEAATSAAVRDGWLQTGDLGYLDEDGFLFVTGRRKELIALASGKKVQPAIVESLLLADPLISQAVVIGEGRNFLAALIVPNREVLAARLPPEDAALAGPVDLEHTTVRDIFANSIEHALKKLAPWEQVKKFVLLDREFTAERGEVTAKLSFRREQIELNFREQIDALY